MDAVNKSMLESLPLSRSLHAMVICKVYGRCALEKVYYGESTVYRSCDYFTDCRARSIYFTDDVMRAYAQHFDDTRLLPIGSHMVKTFVCSFMSAPLTCASLHKRPAKMMNVRALPPPPPLHRDWTLDCAPLRVVAFIRMFATCCLPVPTAVRWNSRRSSPSS